MQTHVPMSLVAQFFSTPPMSTEARCAARPGLALLGCLKRFIQNWSFKHKEQARVSALRFFIGANRTKKTQQTPFAQPTWFACCFRPCLGSLAVLDLDGSASSYSLERGSWSSTNSKNRSIFRSQRPVYCYSAQTPSKRCTI